MSSRKSNGHGQSELSEHPEIPTRSKYARRPSASAKALADLNVLEFGEGISAPFCTKLMAGFGAEVIKVELPGAGDAARRNGPFPGDIPHPEKSGLYLFLNTGKFGITLDPGLPSGREILLELVKQADVLVENYTPCEMLEWGLDHESLRAVNPWLIVTSITPFGHKGPYASYKGHAINSAATAGIAYRIGDSRREPLTTPLSRSNYWGALNAAAATMMAVLARRLTGRGQHVDISEVECMSTLISCLNTVQYVGTGVYPKRAGRRLIIAYPWVILPCKDGFFSLITAPTQDRHWQRFVEMMGNPEWASNPRYQNREAMGKEYPEEVDQLLMPWLAQRTKKELWDMCRAVRAPFQPVHTIGEIVHMEHLQVRGFFQDMDHPEAGRLTYPGAPFQLRKTPWRVTRPAPTLGQHNELIYCGRLGMSHQGLVALRRSGVI